MFISVPNTWQIVPRNETRDTLDQLDAQFPMDDGLQITKEEITSGTDDKTEIKTTESPAIKPTLSPTVSPSAVPVAHDGASTKPVAPTESPPVAPAADLGKIRDEELHKRLASMTDTERLAEHAKSEKSFDEQLAALNLKVLIMCWRVAYLCSQRNDMVKECVLPVLVLARFECLDAG